MAKVLLVDTGFSSMPLLRALLDGGHEVDVVGNRPSDCLVRRAARYWQMDYSDAPALAALVDRQGYRHLVPGCTDRSYASCVAAGRGRYAGLDSPAALSAISHKGQFRRIARELGLPVPDTFGDPGAAIGRSVIVKPANAYSGLGITVLHRADRGAIEEAVRLAESVSSTREAVVEEFVEGQLHSHSAFLAGGRVACDFLVQEDGTANRFVVDTSRVLDPAGQAAMLATLRDCAEALAARLDLRDGLLHTQFIARDQRVWLVEATRRCPGDLYGLLVELSTGYDYAGAYVATFLGERAPARPAGALRPVLRHTISVPAAQAFDHVRFRRRLDILRYVPLSTVGETLAPSPGSRVAVMFCAERSQADLDVLYAAALRRELYAVCDGLDRGEGT